MPSLATDLRNKLERAIIDARDVAEAGAKAALEGLGVHHHEPYPHQTPDQRALRTQLRARARQLGDTQNARGELAIGHLIHECGYEHWHRMLFARFLAENDLLIEPDSGMAVSLAEAEELAKAAKIDLWTYASRCAQQMLPQIFRPDDPLLQIGLANEHRIRLESLLAGLDAATFKADDSLGWVYQFWQSKRKDEVNARGDKIDARSISAVTQLFTEHYMVLFLLHNTIGAWHAGKVLAADPTLARSASSEDELRQAVALKSQGGYAFEYLRFIKSDDGTWRPAAGTFPGWPRHARDLKVLDPCCGSGHFLVATFELLVLLRMAEENLSVEAAIDAVLRDNLHGLELDARCTQIAAFNLAMAAWKLGGANGGGYRPLPPLNIACTGLAPNTPVERWLKLVEPQVARAPLRDRDPIRLGIRGLHDAFSDGPTLGSLIDVSRTRGIGAADWETMRPYLDSALKAESDDDLRAEGVTAQGLLKAAELLAGPDAGYTLVITNVPYLGRGKQDPILQRWCDEHEPDAKADLATAFISRSFGFLARGGSVAVVSPQNWLFLTTYKKLRERLLRDQTWNMIARLGPKGFQTPMWDFNIALKILSRGELDDAHAMLGLDASAAPNPPEKAARLRDQTDLRLLSQAGQRKNPDAAIVLESAGTTSLLGQFARVYQGVGTADINRFVGVFWEFQDTAIWTLYQMAPEKNGVVSGSYGALRWEQGAGALATSPFARVCGQPAWGKRGIKISVNGSLPRSGYTGEHFDCTTGVLIPSDAGHLPAIYTFVTDDQFPAVVRTVDQALSVTERSFEKVPFDLAHWQAVAAEKYPDGLPEPESDDPTQWLFHGRPEASEQPLQVAVARLAGYRWPAEFDQQMRLSTRARDLVKRCDELLPFADDDGIICIPSVRGEEPAADRLLTLLSACGMTPDRNLDDWLRNEFFEEHCKLFHHRPFVWHVWDGRKRDGFHALINYHKLAAPQTARKLLESLTYSYLGEWITRQQDGVRSGAGGAEDRLAAATELQNRLVAILEGEPPFDLFVRWKKLSEQAIGWEPDLNDGVRMNIRPFMTSDIPGGKRGAGILRAKPNIKWDKDRGKEPERKKTEFPWFWGWDGVKVDFMGGKEFKGERFNDCHYSVAAKRAAREAAKKGGK